MRILLVNPPRFEGLPVIREERCEITERYSVLEPYSLLQLGGILREAGHKIKIIDAGPKGMLIGFKNNYFKDTDKLFKWINDKSGLIKIRPDQKLFVQKNLKTRDEKINVVVDIITQLELLSA